MAIAKKAVVWGLFAAGGTVTAFVYPVLILLFLLVALGYVPDGLQFESFYAFASNWIGKLCLFAVLFFSLWHAAHRLRSAAHDFGIRNDALVANVLYAVASLGTLVTAFCLIQ